MAVRFLPRNYQLPITLSALAIGEVFRFDRAHANIFWRKVSDYEICSAYDDKQKAHRRAIVDPTVIVYTLGTAPTALDNNANNTAPVAQNH